MGQVGDRLRGLRDDASGHQVACVGLSSVDVPLLMVVCLSSTIALLL